MALLMGAGGAQQVLQAASNRGSGQDSINEFEILVQEAHDTSIHVQQHVFVTMHRRQWTGAGSRLLNESKPS